MVSDAHSTNKQLHTGHLYTYINLGSESINDSFRYCNSNTDCHKDSLFGMCWVLVLMPAAMCGAKARVCVCVCVKRMCMGMWMYNYACMCLTMCACTHSHKRIAQHVPHTTCTSSLIGDIIPTQYSTVVPNNIHSHSCSLSTIPWRWSCIPPPTIQASPPSPQVAAQT